MSITATTGPSGLPFGRPLTVRDLEDMPDDGHRYELIDGTLLVSPAPGRWHQRAVGNLATRLMERCTDEFEVVVAPFAVHEGIKTELQPDVLVAREVDLTDKDLPVAPMLAVEVLSPSTTLVDLNVKKAVFERMGTPSYWLVDPLDPKLTVFELDERGTYQLVAEVAADKAYEATQPFAVRIVPSELLDKP